MGLMPLHHLITFLDHVASLHCWIVSKSKPFLSEIAPPLTPSLNHLLGPFWFLLTITWVFFIELTNCCEESFAAFGKYYFPGLIYRCIGIYSSGQQYQVFSMSGSEPSSPIKSTEQQHEWVSDGVSEAFPAAASTRSVTWPNPCLVPLLTLFKGVILIQEIRIEIQKIWKVEPGSRTQNDKNQPGV